MPRVARPTLLLPLVAFIHACAAGDRPADVALVRDSAGITIIENSAPAPMQMLAVSAEPVLEIGQVEGADEYQLHGVAHIAQLSDGTIVAANTGSDELRFYDARGYHLRTSGRSGSGPGEFESIDYVRRLTGDTLLVFDGRSRRITLFDAEGGYVRDFSPGTDGRQSSGISGALADGALLTGVHSVLPPTSVDNHRRVIEYFMLHGDSAVTLGSYADAEMNLLYFPDGNRRISILLPFSRDDYSATGPEHAFIGSSDSYEIHVWGGAGVLERIIRSAHVPPRPVTEDLKSAWIEANIEGRTRAAAAAGIPFDEADARRRMQDLQYAPALPAYAGFVATEEGGLWVKDFVLPGAEGTPERWTIFDPDGRIHGMVDLPAQFRPLHVDADTVLGVFRDALDVEYIRGYTIS
jgi:hypothetical protein